MSLQLIAKQMEAKGRGGDSVLVHMTPGEVEGLQKLAESAGGSLTVNPETGLVEAFSLKELIPALVGGALVASGVGMPLAVAGGALTGGFQAKRDKKDFLTGALMGGLGAYGGAGLAGGLGAAGNAVASQAATAANPAFMGPMPGAATGLQAAKTGFSALGSETGRTAFMQGVGGVGGLAKAASAVAAPMMTGEQKMAEAPVDDEMYSYTFNPGRTGAERTPRAGSSEENYFQSSFSPMRRIRAQDYAAQGGLMRLAKGGETTSPSESDAALAYLMGEDSGSSAGLPAMASQAPVVGGDNMYAFDPVTGTFLRNPNVAGAKSAAVGSRVGTSFAGSGGDGNTTMSPQTERFLSWEESTPEGKAHREARMAEVQNLFNLGPTGALVSALKGNTAKTPNFGTLFGTPDSYKSYIADKDSGIFEGRSQSGGNTGESWESLPADMRGGDSGGDSGGGGGDDGGRGVGGGNPDPGGYSGYDSGRPDFAAGGILGLAKGGMASGGFVVPADVVSALGNGSTDAGLRKLSAMMGDVKPIKGKGDGLSDSIPTNIDGKQAARVADGEAYIDPKTVKRLGGAKKLYAMMDKIRAQAHGKTSQQRPVNPAKVMA